MSSPGERLEVLFTHAVDMQSRHSLLHDEHFFSKFPRANAVAAYIARNLDKNNLAPERIHEKVSAYLEALHRGEKCATARYHDLSRKITFVAEERNHVYTLQKVPRRPLYFQKEGRPRKGWHGRRFFKVKNIK